MTKISALLAVGSLAVLAACSNDPAQQAANQRDVECAGAALVGTVVGGALGNQIGGGTGRTIATGAGALGGAAAATSMSGAC